MGDDVTTPRGYASFPRRILAIVTDVVILLGLFISGGSGIAAADTELGWIGILTLFVVILLYDPVLVSTQGRTIGHLAFNLRVVHEDRDDRISFPGAFLRYLLKGVLGLFSFFFMLLTRRHQALHDKLSRSAVIIHDLSKAKPAHYLIEREVSPGSELEISGARRVFVIVGYCLVIVVMAFVVSELRVSEACMMDDRCSREESLLLDLIGLVIVVGCGLAVVLGWLGRLPGARAGPAAWRKSS